MKLTSYIAGNLEKVGLDPASYFTAGNYTLEVTMTDLTIHDANDTAITKLITGFTLAEDPGVFAYIEDQYSGEGSPEVTDNAPITVTLSQAAASDVTMEYQTFAGTATAGDGDYSNSSSGTLTIAAGSTSASFTVPVLADTRAENNETATVTLSSGHGVVWAEGSHWHCVPTREMRRGNCLKFPTAARRVPVGEKISRTP